MYAATQCKIVGKSAFRKQHDSVSRNEITRHFDCCNCWIMAYLRRNVGDLCFHSKPDSLEVFGGLSSMGKGLYISSIHDLWYQNSFPMHFPFSLLQNAAAAQTSLDPPSIMYPRIPTTNLQQIEIIQLLPIPQDISLNLRPINPSHEILHASQRETPYL